MKIIYNQKENILEIAEFAPWRKMPFRLISLWQNKKGNFLYTKGRYVKSNWVLIGEL